MVTPALSGLCIRCQMSVSAAPPDSPFGFLAMSTKLPPCCRWLPECSGARPAPDCSVHKSFFPCPRRLHDSAHGVPIGLTVRDNLIRPFFFLLLDYCYVPPTFQRVLVCPLHVP